MNTSAKTIVEELIEANDDADGLREYFEECDNIYFNIDRTQRYRGAMVEMYEDYGYFITIDSRKGIVIIHSDSCADIEPMPSDLWEAVDKTCVKIFNGQMNQKETCNTTLEDYYAVHTIDVCICCEPLAVDMEDANLIDIERSAFKGAEQNLVLNAYKRYDGKTVVDLRLDIEINRKDIEYFDKLWETYDPTYATNDVIYTALADFDRQHGSNYHNRVTDSSDIGLGTVAEVFDIFYEKLWTSHKL